MVGRRGWQGYRKHRDAGGVLGRERGTVGGDVVRELTEVHNWLGWKNSMRQRVGLWCGEVVGKAIWRSDRPVHIRTHIPFPITRHMLRRRKCSWKRVVSVLSLPFWTPCGGVGLVIRSWSIIRGADHSQIGQIGGPGWTRHELLVAKGAGWHVGLG
jgi:hypothetical protein